MAVRLKWTMSVITVLACVNVTVCPRWPFKSRTSYEKLREEELPEEETPMTKSGYEDKYGRIKLFKRGQFKRSKWPEDGSLDSVRQSKLAAKYAKEIKCNDAYYMMLYLHVTNPENLSFSQVKNVHDEINANYLGWPEKMLVTAFNVAQTGTEMDLQWLLYLYVIRIVVHTTVAYDEDFLPVMQTSHKWILKVLASMMKKDCRIIDPVAMCERELSEYKRDLRLRDPAAFLTSHWKDLCHNSKLVGGFLGVNDNTDSVPADQPVCENDYTLNLLYLNDVFEKGEVTALLNDFGVFEEGDELIGYLKFNITQIKSGRTSFETYVVALAAFHEHVLLAIHAMTLRICYNFMKELKSINQYDRGKNVQQFFKPYNRWCVLLGVPKTDSLYMALSSSNDNYFLDLTIGQLRNKVMKILKEIDGLSKVTPSPDNHTEMSLAKINVNNSRLMEIVKKHHITLDTTFDVSEWPSTGPTILCAEVLSKFLEKIFTGINFKVVSSLVMLKKSKYLDYISPNPNTSSHVNI